MKFRLARRWPAALAVAALLTLLLTTLRTAASGDELMVSEQMVSELMVSALIPEGPPAPIVDAAALSDSCASNGWAGCDCGNCSDCCVCWDGCAAASGASRGVPNWLAIDSLIWWARGMDTPPLVTSGPPASGGVIGAPGTQIEYGDRPILDQARWGGRLRFGRWFDSEQTWGLEGEYLLTGGIADHFEASSATAPGVVLARPFVNVISQQADALLLSDLGILRGSIEVNSSSSLQSAGARLRRRLPVEASSGGRWELLMGYRRTSLDEALGIREEVIVMDPNGVVVFQDRDLFNTDSVFQGGELGVQHHRSRGVWELDLLAKIALGSTRQRAWIRGETARIDGASTTVFPGGILAIPPYANTAGDAGGNIGVHQRSRFGALSEFGATLKCRVAPRSTVSVGGALLLWSNVVRPGRQIDTAINPDALPPPLLPTSNPARPAFRFQDELIWLLGMNIGLETQW